MTKIMMRMQVCGCGGPADESNPLHSVQEVTFG